MVRKAKTTKKRRNGRAKRVQPARKTTTSGRKRKAASQLPRPTKKSMVSPDVKNHLSVYMNPFSTATQQPKIPDGKASESLGSRQQVVKSFVPATSSTVDIILYPGLSSGAIVGNVRDAGLGERTWYVMGYDDHGDIDFDNLSTSTGAGKLTMDDKINQWRCVSQGLKISLTNDDQTNNGWWEAVRYTPSNAAENYALTAKGDLFDRETGTITPVGDLLTFPNKNIVEDRTYQTGLLRDIDKHLFELHPIKDEHDFVAVQDDHDIIATDVTTIINDVDGSTVTGFTLSNAGRAEPQLMIGSMLDHSYDYVYLRLHIRKGDTSADSSQLMLHLVANHEMIYNTSVRDSKYHTRGAIAGPNVVNSAVGVKRYNDLPSMMVG